MPSPQGLGNIEVTTENEFEPLTQNLLKVTGPKGYCTYFAYAHGPQIAGRGGAFTDIDGASAGATTSMSALPGTIRSAEVGCLVKLKKSGANGYLELYYLVAPGTDNDTLVVGANLLNDGWKDGDDGTFEVYSVNTNPLSRSLVIQERRCAGSAWAAADLVTTYVRRDSQFYGTYYSDLTTVVDPWSNRTFVNQSYCRICVDRKDRTIPVLSSTAQLATATGATSDGVPVEMRISQRVSDIYGRINWSHSSNYGSSAGQTEESKYEYYAAGNSITPPSGEYSALLKTVTSTRTQINGDSQSDPPSPKTITTTYNYDARGNVTRIAAPRAAIPFPYAVADFDSTILTNNRGQVIRITGPTGGAVGSARTSESWMFYDRDGRLVHQCDKFVPFGENDPSGGTGSEQTDSAIIAAFPRPAYVTSGNPHWTSGWIHTIYTYSAWGDLTQQRRDSDIGAAGLVLAQTDYAYDLEGRCNYVNDPEGHITVSSYDSRDLLSYTTAGLRLGTTGGYDTSCASALNYHYDMNGNLTEEIDALGYSSSMYTTISTGPFAPAIAAVVASLCTS